jgi:hypothetical protein
MPNSEQASSLHFKVFISKSIVRAAFETSVLCTPHNLYSNHESIVPAAVEGKDSALSNIHFSFGAEK